MKTDFNFDTVGKRMPYTVPDHFFDQLESNILRQVQEGAVSRDSRKVALVPCWLKSVAVAAVVVLIGVGSWWLTERTPSVLPDVEQAFSNLTLEDQDYMLAVYQEDLYLNE